MREEIIKAAKVLESGGTILYPTDTIWGIGCDATNYRAVQKVFKIKRRRYNKSFIILLDQPEKLIQYVEFVPEITWDLIHSIDSPLTIVYPKGKNLARNVLGSDQSIAIRIVKDQFCKRLISLFNKPIVSTSANIADEKSPLIYSDISVEMKSIVDYVVDARHDKLNETKPSTMIRIKENGDYEVLRS